MNEILKEDEDEDVVRLSLTVKVPRHLPVGVAEVLEDSLEKALQLLARGSTFKDLLERVDSVAQLVVTQIRPSGIMLDERIAQMVMFRKMFEEGDWLTAEDVNKLQKNPSAKKSLPVSSWKRRGRVFSVSYGGEEYYPRYQFDAMYQPLPVIGDILTAYGEYADSWSIAAWFQFPNGWIANEASGGTVPVAPKDALGRRHEVINAARNQKGTYVA